MLIESDCKQKGEERGSSPIDILTETLIQVLAIAAAPSSAANPQP
jgi:hypothetical protein